MCNSSVKSLLFFFAFYHSVLNYIDLIIKIIETFPRHMFVVIENGAFCPWLHHLK